MHREKDSWPYGHLTRYQLKILRPNLLQIFSHCYQFYCGKHLTWLYSQSFFSDSFLITNSNCYCRRYNVSIEVYYHSPFIALLKQSYQTVLKMDSMLHSCCFSSLSGWWWWGGSRKINQKSVINGESAEKLYAQIIHILYNNWNAADRCSCSCCCSTARFMFQS